MVEQDHKMSCATSLFTDLVLGSPDVQISLDCVDSSPEFRGGVSASVDTVVSATAFTPDKLLVAVGHQCCLTISINPRSKNGKDADEDDEEAEETSLEFDEPIDALEWDPEGRCLIVGDASGTLHFVTREGEVVFSHGILPKGDTLAVSADDP